MSNVIKIALTGGPCSGKSAALEILKVHYENQGYTVITMPECAEILIHNGVPRDDIFRFEDEIIAYQLKAESRINSQISEMTEDKILVLYDRGIADALSYVTSAEAVILKNKYNIDLIQIWNRYDAVMLLETAESSDYTMNGVRPENREQSLKAQNALIDVWVGHPHLRFIKASRNFEDKINNLIAEIDSILGNMEYEKKYLIEYPDFKLLSEYKPFKAEIEQIYLLSDIGSHRIRKRGAYGSYSYFETLKIRISGDKCYEYENIISGEKYEELRADADPKKHPIVKNRYCFLYHGQYFELDIFPFWSDKALLELELCNDNDSPDLPPEITVIEDVSKNKKYKNNYLASVNWNENS